MQEEQKTEQESAIKRSIEAQLEEWSSELDRLQAEAERKQLTEGMKKQLFEKAQDVRARIEELRKSGEEKRDQLMKDLRERWQHLREAFS